MLARPHLLAVFALLLIGVSASRAQTLADPPPAPVPAQILTAKRVFISNVSEDLPLPARTSELTYNQFYSGMKNWGRFELVGTPADSDLVFEVRFAYVARDSFDEEYFSLRILDSKTHFVLWVLSEAVPYSANTKKKRQFFDQTIVSLLDDVKKLAAPQVASSAGN